MKINLSFILLIILSLYTGYIDKLLLFLCCLLIHECGHVVFIKMFKQKINKFSISIYGGTLELDNNIYEQLSTMKQTIIYFSGVIINLLMYLLFKNNEFGKYNLILFCFNLIPIYPLDGYNIIRLLTNKTLLYNISIISFLLLIMYAIYSNSLGLIIIVVILIYKNIIYYRSKDKIYLVNILKNMI